MRGELESDKIDWKKDSQSFDRVSEDYDAYRPGYPGELVETILARSGIPTGGKILEVGSGTGKATELFARHGFSMLCIEQGSSLVAVAAQKLKVFPGVELVTTRFEDWQELAGEFDLVISAQAWHWIAKDVGYAKAARALKEGGWLAVFWNMYPDPKGEIYDEIDQVYQERTPQLKPKLDYKVLIRERENDIAASGWFGKVEVRRFPWSKQFNTQQYLGLMNTYSDHLRLSEEKRKSLFEGVADAIDRHGGIIERPYVTVLYMAKKA